MALLPQALGTDQEPTSAQMHARMAVPEGRAAAAAAIEEQRTHFDMLGLQLGYAYEPGALVPDGTPPPPPVSPRVFEPSARPGARLPHAWLVPSSAEEGTARLSSLDLIASDTMTLLSFSDHEVWEEAASAVDGIPLAHHRVGIDVHDKAGAFRGLCGLPEGGALIVRPDQHVAARFASLPDAPNSTVAGALDAILSRGQEIH
jgi:2,4-dichlorophenol 6-monooxygenase